MKNVIILIIIIVLAGLGVWYWTSARDQSSAPSMGNGEMMEDENMMEGEPMEGEPMEELSEDEMMMEDEDGEGPVFDIAASNFKYDVTEIRVKKGDIVTINLTSEEGMHDWSVDEFNAGTVKITAGQSDTIDFRADKAGTFEYYCSVGTHRKMGMVGTLVVEE